jgi:hypothetical protein
MRMLVNHFINVVHFMHFLDKCTQFIAPTKDISVTCFATSVPSSGSAKCQVQNHLSIISYYSQGYVFCTSSVVDVYYVQMYNLFRFLKTYICSLVSKRVGDTALIFIYI